MAAERGHRVRLFEAGSELGGQLLLAAQVPKLADMARPIAYFRQRFAALGVEVHLNATVDAAQLAEWTGDVVFATGSRAATWSDGGFPAAPELPTLSAREALTASLPRGIRALVYATDHGMEALGAADRIATGGAQVTFATPAAALGAWVENVTRPFILDRLTRAGVSFRLLSELRIEQDGSTRLTGPGGDPIAVGAAFDVIVLALGGLANDDLYRHASADSITTHIVGDAYAPRRIVAATQQAYELASRL